MNSKVIHILPALVLSLVAVGLAIYGLTLERRQPVETPEQSNPQVELEGTVESVKQPTFRYGIARKTLQAGEALEKDSVLAVKSEEKLEGLVEFEALPFGEVLAARVDKGLPITEGILNEQSPVQKLLTPGHKALAVELTNLASIGGLIRPGDAIDIFASFSKAGEASAVSTRLFSAVPVLAVRGSMSTTNDLDEEEKRKNPTMVLEIPEADVPRFTLALRESQLTFAATKPNRLIGETSAPGQDQPRAERPPERLVSYISDIRPEKELEKGVRRRAESEDVEEPQRREIRIYEGGESRSIYVQ